MTLNPTTIDPENAPSVTVGVPVYNGQRYLRATLNSLMAQTYPNLEIVISDNASTDRTEQICREFVEADSRFRYLRLDHNIGPARNFNRCLEFATGKFFKWNAADDVCAPEFIERCVVMLERDPSLVLAHPRTRIIDNEGKVVANYEYELGLSETTPAQRLRNLVFANHRVHGGHELFGVIRTDALRRTNLCGCYVRADSVLLAKLAMLGRFGRVDEYLFYNRDHTDRSSKAIGKKHVRAGSVLSQYIGCGPLPGAEWWDPKMKGKIVFPEFRVLREYWRAVSNASIPARDKLACYRVLSWFGVNHIPKMGRDLVIATEQAATKAVRAIIPANTSLKTEPQRR